MGDNTKRILQSSQSQGHKLPGRGEPKVDSVGESVLGEVEVAVAAHKKGPGLHQSLSSCTVVTRLTVDNGQQGNATATRRWRRLWILV